MAARPSEQKSSLVRKPRLFGMTVGMRAATWTLLGIWVTASSAYPVCNTDRRTNSSEMFWTRESPYKMARLRAENDAPHRQRSYYAANLLDGRGEPHGFRLLSAPVFAVLL